MNPLGLIVASGVYPVMSLDPRPSVTRGPEASSPRLPRPSNVVPFILDDLFYG